MEGCPPDWGKLSIRGRLNAVHSDGGYVRDWQAKKRNFEVCAVAEAVVI